MTITAQVAEEDGSAFYADRSEGQVSSEAQARALADILGHRLKEKVPSDLLKR
jgi:hypothetical protein